MKLLHIPNKGAIVVREIESVGLVQTLFSEPSYFTITMRSGLRYDCVETDAGGIDSARVRLIEAMEGLA